MRLLLMMLLLLLFYTGYGYAQTTHHTVRAGETLFSISRQHDVSVQELREWNNLSDNVIQVGQRLLVHVDGQEDSVIPDRLGEDAITHSVEAGETLFRISRMYDVSVDDIKKWNNLDSNTISIGQQLTIHTSAPAEDSEADRIDDDPVAAESHDTPDVPEATSEERTPRYYEVRPGDTMFGIASRHNMSVDELQELNDLDDTRIYVGQELRVRRGPAPTPSVTAEWDIESTPQGKFVTYTISEQDTIDQLLQYHNMDRKEFRALNTGLSLSDIRPGDEVTLLLSATSQQKNPYRKELSDDEATRMRVTRYPEEKRGQTTTSGDLYNPENLTAAHPNLSLGSVVYIKNPETGRGVFVHINDRTPENRLLLSDAAFRSLGYHDSTQLIAKIHQADDN